jgi:hypothetical protein
MAGGKEKKKKEKKKSIQHGPVLCRLVLSCPIRFMPYPLVFDWHKNAWSFGTFFFVFILPPRLNASFLSLVSACLLALKHACV